MSTTMIHPNGINSRENCSPDKVRRLKALGWREETDTPTEVVQFQESIKSNEILKTIEQKKAEMNCKVETILPDPIPPVFTQSIKEPEIPKETVKEQTEKNNEKQLTEDERKQQIRDKAAATRLANKRGRGGK